MDYSKKGKNASLSIDPTVTRELMTGSGASQREMRQQGYNRMVRVVESMPAKQAAKTEDKAIKACYRACNAGMYGHKF